jgi:hypothetical protein
MYRIVGPARQTGGVLAKNEECEFALHVDHFGSTNGIYETHERSSNAMAPGGTVNMRTCYTEILRLVTSAAVVVAVVVDHTGNHGC